MHIEVGNLTQEPFSRLWWSENMQRRRSMVAKRDYSEMTVCQSCFIPRSLNYTGITDDELHMFGEGA